MKILHRLTSLGLALAAIAAPMLAHADVTVGVTLSSTGPAASLGVPQKNTFALLPAMLGGQKVRYVVLDDASDPTAASRNARKLATEEMADVIIGSSTSPGGIAVSEVASSLEIPQISLAPMAPQMARNRWAFAVPQPNPVMLSAVVQHMKEAGIKSVGYIGFADSLGDQVYSAFELFAIPAGIKTVANERYARGDQSVTGQVLKLMASSPDAVLLGGSGTPGALPQIALADRGFRKPMYQNHAVISNEFLRVGGKAVEGTYAPTGPVVVAEQLPDTNPVKKKAMTFVKLYEGKYGAGTRNAFGAYAYDAYLLLDAAVPAALAKAKSGTPAFRSALRDALEASREVVGTHGVYAMTPGDHSGTDQRARVLVRVENGQWKLVR